MARLDDDEKLCVRDCMRHLEQLIALAVVGNKQDCLDNELITLTALREDGYDARTVISNPLARHLRKFKKPGNAVSLIYY